MKNTFEILVLIIAWSSFGIWEWCVYEWAKDVAGPIIRVDLVLLLPALIALTVWMVIRFFKQKKANNF